MIYGLNFPQLKPGSMALLFSGPNLLTATSSAVPYQQVLNMFGAPIPASVILYPISGDTLTVEQSRDGGLTYTLLPSGTVTVPDTGFVLTAGCTHIRVTRTAGSSGTSYFTVC